MFRYILYTLLVLTIAAFIIYLVTRNKGYSTDENTIAQGKDLFMKYCSSCHALEADGMGPPLGGITNLLSEKELTAFINNPSKAIESGNERAVSLHARYKQVMPSFAQLQENEVSAILAYVHQQTQLNHLAALVLNGDTIQGGLTGKLTPPIKSPG